MTNKNIYVLARDVAENAKLNHEIAEELRKCTPSSLENKGSKFSSKLALNRKRMGLNKTLYLLTLFIPTFVQAETCTATPDCKSLGYTQTSCPDGGGVKCPWNTSLMYCCKKCAPSCEVKTCQIGDILYSDKKCYTCSNKDELPETHPIGVVFASGKAVGLTTLGQMSWLDANSACSNYRAEGVNGWDLPSKDELLWMHSHFNEVQTGLENAGGQQFTGNSYWSSSHYGTNGFGEKFYWLVYPKSGSDTYASETSLIFVRPVLAF